MRNAELGTWNLFFLVLPVINYECSYHTRYPSTTGKDKYDKKGSAAFVNHCKRRKDDT